MIRKVLIIGIILSLTVISFLPVLAEDESVIERTSVSGMTILLEKNTSELAEVALLLKSGSGLDPTGKKGTAEIMNNFIRMRFNNSDNKYGQIRLETNPEFTLIRITVAPENLKMALQDVKELLAYPIYSHDLIADLKKFMESDLKSMSAIAKAYYTFNKEYYGAEHPYNEFPESESISSITGYDVYRWYRQTYQPGNVILSVSGGVKQSINDFNKFFSNMMTESIDRRLSIQPTILHQNKTINKVDPNGRVASFAIGFAAPRIQDPEYPAFRMITYYLSEYHHYFEQLRVNEGLIYSDYIFYNYIEKPKSPNIVFMTTTDPKSVDMVTAKTLDVINQIIKDGIEDQIMSKIVNGIKLNVESRKNSGRGKAAINGLSHYLQSQLVDDERLLKELEKVTNKNIKDAASKYFTNYIKVIYRPKVKAEHF